MSLISVLNRIRAIGTLLTFVGRFLTRLATGPSTTEIVVGGPPAYPDQTGMSQDSNSSNGELDEEPAVDEEQVRSEQRDLFETTKPE